MDKIKLRAGTTQVLAV